MTDFLDWSRYFLRTGSHGVQHLGSGDSTQAMEWHFRGSRLSRSCEVRHYSNDLIAGKVLSKWKAWLTTQIVREVINILLLDFQRTLESSFDFFTRVRDLTYIICRPGVCALFCVFLPFQILPSSTSLTKISSHKFENLAVSHESNKYVIIE